MRTLVIGDIHGNYKGMMQALSRANFDYEKDTLISLGDLVDGHSQSFEVVEELLKIKNLIVIKGNHDDWFLQWIDTGKNPTQWRQGQKATGISYLNAHDPTMPWWDFLPTAGGGMEAVEMIKPEFIPQSHIDLFKNQKHYFLDDENRLFVHGGFNRHFPLDEQGDILWWDRDLWSQALSWKAMSKINMNDNQPEGWKPKFKMIGDFKEVYIGHTSTQFWNEDKPMNAANIWNLDTGGGWFGYISVMDIDTKEFWQSDDARSLYPEFRGRAS